ncbi:Hypothetical Protein FCC1311_035332 [Hondaea fermentalgiana]|uniref:PH domain-containing protein n=1 Tax=Hondaea fermentalgiana TaxID=2315210 RepID=A0A2R5GGC8_9STRA|nr:Hypothetical Protein FCC1311_035332 [Hondaea fermentalgiana]|eukprot:GBG27311.1 Hypothetical Protein FCC1311_035332 [Hondaea fermentalgiana]
MKTARCFADVFQAPSLESGQHHLLAQRNASHQQQAPDQEEEKEGQGDAPRRAPRVLKFDVVRRKGKLNVLYKKCLLCVDDAQMALYMADIDGYGAIKPPAQLIPIEQILSARQIQTGKCAFQLSVRVYFFDGIHAARPNQEKTIHFLAATPVQAAEWVESINAVVKQRSPATMPPAMTPSVMTPLAMTPPPKPPKPMHMRPAHSTALASTAVTGFDPALTTESGGDAFTSEPCAGHASSTSAIARVPAANAAALAASSSAPSRYGANGCCSFLE